MEKDYSQLSKDIVENVGGSKNVKSLNHCMTRLRFVLKDESKVNLAKLKKIDGVSDVIISGGQYQVVIGMHVADVYDSIGSNTDVVLNNSESSSSDETNDSKGNIVTTFMDVVSSIFMPMLTAMSGAGILKGILIALTTLGWMSTKSGTYTILYSAADAFFYFLPLVLAYTAATKFKADKFVAVSIAGAMIYPNILNAYNAKTSLTFLGIPVQLISYTSSVIPIIITVYVLSKLEKLLRKIIPNLIRGIFLPLLCIVIMVPAALIVIGPVTTIVANGIAAGYTFLYNLSPPIAGGVLATIWPVMIMFGLHWGLIPIVMNNLSKFKYDTLLPVTVATNFSQAGAVLGVFLKSKDRKTKDTAISACFSALIGGITEPAIYGINLKYKRPFYIACAFTGIGGIITGFANAQWPGIMSACILTLPALALLKGGIAVLISSILGFVGTAICTYLFGFDDSMLEKSNTEKIAPKTSEKVELKACVSGKVIPITEVEDEAFSSKTLGDGVAIIPDRNVVLSPASGKISVVMEETGHAVGVTLDNGAELLIHIGIDTVKMNGDGFKPCVKAGDIVKVGDELIKFDLNKIKEKGFKTTTMMTITNSDEYPNLEFLSGMQVEAGKDTIMKF